MLTSIYYALAIAAYSIFLIQFFISIFGGSDLDMDIDFDGDGIMDLTWGDIFSFKGFIHFLMGFAGWLSLTSIQSGEIYWYDYVIAIFIGLCFVIMLVFLGKGLLKLKQENTGATGWDFVGHTGHISIICESEPNAYYIIMDEFNAEEIKVYSRDGLKYELSNEVTVICYENGKYFIN